MSAPLWTSAEAEAATGGTGSRAWQATGLSIDSRAVAAGDLFVALRGETHDGHDHVAAALAAGASAATVASVSLRLLGYAPPRVALVARTLALMKRSGASDGEVGAYLAALP